MTEDQIKQLLAVEDEEYRKLQQEHHTYEQRLTILAQKTTLTSEEDFEEKVLKKRKLKLKDRMSEIIRNRQLAHSA